MSETQINGVNQRSGEQPDWLLRILGGAFLIAAVVAAVLVFQVVRAEVRKVTIVDVGGRPIIDTPPVGSGDENGDTQGGSVAPQPMVVDVSPSGSPKWDGASRINVLVMGLDFSDWRAGEGPPRTDTMIVLTFDPGSETAAMLSVPRDLWVNVPGFGQNKINQAYALGEGALLPGGGPELAVRTVEEFLGIDINYYAQIDFYVFRDFINFIGGVCVQVTETVTIDVIDKNTKVILEPGQRCMKGAHLLGFIRARNTGDGDFGRANRQQQAIIAIRDKMLHPDIQKMLLTNPIEMWNIFSTGIRTNIPFEDALSLGLNALQINPAQIGRFAIAPPDHVIHTTTQDGDQILKPITQNIRKLRDEIFTINSSIGPGAVGADPAELMLAEKAKVGVFNGSTVSGLAGTTRDYLTTLGVNVVEVGNADYVSMTTIYDYTGNPYTVKYLVNLLGINKARIFSSYDPNSEIDVSIVLGNDWSVP
jgi:LCP family protein required for cell wall assembly